MRIGVMVPTHGRSRQLGACLAALAQQSRPPDQVVVITRAADHASQAVIEPWRQGVMFEVAVCLVDQPGMVAAMRAGVQAARCDVLAMTDDDAVPRPDWLERLEIHYQDERVGGVGGRDVIHTPRGLLEGSASVVGRMSWFGRATGNHHLGQGPPRPVDILKGANMSLRLEFWVLDGPFQGSGAQPSWEIDVCLRARRCGYAIIYDPAAIVDHYWAPRELGDEFGRPSSASPQQLRNAAFNEAYATLRWMRWWRRPGAGAYLLLLGSALLPGVIGSLVPLVRGEPPRRILEATKAALAGRAAALFALARTRQSTVR